MRIYGLTRINTAGEFVRNGDYCESLTKFAMTTNVIKDYINSVFDSDWNSFAFSEGTDENGFTKESILKNLLEFKDDHIQGPESHIGYEFFEQEVPYVEVIDDQLL